MWPLDRDIEQAIAEIRALRVLKWKLDYCDKNDLYRTVSNSRGQKRRAPDICAAPEPTDADIGFPIETLAVRWGEVGYLVIELSALPKLPMKQRNAILKLGGLNK